VVVAVVVMAVVVVAVVVVVVVVVVHKNFVALSEAWLFVLLLGS
jgi:hypothetical protein